MSDFQRKKLTNKSNTTNAILFLCVKKMRLLKTTYKVSVMFFLPTR